MLQRGLGQADGYRLPAGDHAKLLVECPGERIPVNSGRWSHGRIMTLGSDKPGISGLLSGSTGPICLGLNRADLSRTQPPRCSIGAVISDPMFHRGGAGRGGGGGWGGGGGGG